MEKIINDFLEDYRKYIDCYFVDFIDFLDEKKWYEDKSNCEVSRSYVFEDNDLWKHSTEFLKNLLDFSKQHWTSFLDIIKQKGYNFTNKSHDPLFIMKQIYDMGNFHTWWKTRDDYLIQK